MKKAKLAVLSTAIERSTNSSSIFTHSASGASSLRRAEADAERSRQIALKERHNCDAIGFSQREISDFITVNNKLAEYGERINDAAKFHPD
jgi:hypothetical protein